MVVGGGLGILLRNLHTPCFALRDKRARGHVWPSQGSSPPSILTSKSKQVQTFLDLQVLWWSEGDLNPRHADFQSAALPTELPDLMGAPVAREVILPAYQAQVKK